MAYDEDLADRIGELVAAERAVDQKKMFGGLAFLLEGNLVIAASGQGGILVRVGPGGQEGPMGAYPDGRDPKVSASGAPNPCVPGGCDSVASDDAPTPDRWSSSAV